MTPTTYGYRIPSIGDFSKGVAGWMSQLIYNWNRINNHSHNGIDSPLLGISALINTASVLTKTTNYSVNNTDVMIVCNGTFQITLPDATWFVGERHEIVNSGAGVITIATSPGQTISGAGN